MRKSIKVMVSVVSALLVVLIIGGIIGIVKTKNSKFFTAEHVHSEIVDIGKPATCTTTGLSDGKHCSTCGKIIVAQTVTPTVEHNYIAGSCKFCGLDKNSYYLLGTVNDWTWSDEYLFAPCDLNAAESNMVAQFKLTIALDEGEHVKIWKGNGDWRYNHYSGMDNCSYAFFDSVDLTITESGTYTFYLKFYEDGGDCVYVAKMD